MYCVACTHWSTDGGHTETQTDTHMKGTQRVCSLRNRFSSDCIIDLEYNMSMSKVKDTVNLVLMHQMKSVQWVEYYL